MVRVITQETFDAVVKENIEEFGLEKEEAIKEAIAQFESQVLMLIIIFTSTDYRAYFIFVKKYNYVRIFEGFLRLLTYYKIKIT